MDRTAINALIGMVHYAKFRDSTGHPSPLATWEELPPSERYENAAVALLMLDELAAMGLIEKKADFGLRDRFGEGDCAELMELLEREWKEGSPTTASST